MLTVFEGLEEKLSQAVETEEWKTLQKQFNEAEIIYMIGNGGNMAVMVLLMLHDLQTRKCIV